MAPLVGYAIPGLNGSGFGIPVLAAIGIATGMSAAVLLVGTTAPWAPWALNTFLFRNDYEAMFESGNRASRTYNQSLSDRLGVGVDANGILIDLLQVRPVPAVEEDPTKPAQEV